MANITTTTVADTIPTVVAAQALGYLKSNTVLARLVARDWDNEVASHGQTIKIGYPGALSANDKTINTEVTLQVPANNAYTVTLNKHKEVSFLIEDPAKWFARPDWQALHIQQALAVLAEQIDTDLAGLYTGFSQTIDATSLSGSLLESDFREGRRLLNAAKAPLSQRVAVLHEDAEYEALGIEKITNRDYAETLGQGASDAMIGRFAGFDMFMDQNIVVAATQCKNMFFQRNAMVLATRPMATAGPDLGVRQVVMDEDGIGLRVTMSYNAGHLGVQVTVDVLYGVTELRDNHGVVVSTSEI